MLEQLHFHSTLTSELALPEVCGQSHMTPPLRAGKSSIPVCVAGRMSFPCPIIDVPLGPLGTFVQREIAIKGGAR